MNGEQTKKAIVALIAVAVIVTMSIAKLLFTRADVVQRVRAAIPGFPNNGLNRASIDKDSRLAPTIRAGELLPQHPEEPSTQNTDSQFPPEKPRLWDTTSPSTRNSNTEISRPGEPLPEHPAERPNAEAGKAPREGSRLTDDWDGLRPTLEDHGFTFAGGLAAYMGKNLTGGSDTRDVGEAYLVNINLILDSEKLWGYKGGTFLVNFRNQNGLQDHSLDGSLAGTSHLYSPSRTQISEAWYEQKLFDETLRVRLGKIDANTEFAFVANGGEFLNGFAGNSPTILDFPTNPDPAFGAELFVYPTSHFYTGIAVYDGSALEGAHTGLLGPAHLFDGPSQFWIGEIGAIWTGSGKLDGRLGIGVWYHTGTFDRFDGGTERDAAGPYITFDQTLWRKTPDVTDTAGGIAMFALAGSASPAVSAANYQIGGGLRWTVPLPSRASDVLGLGVDYIRLSDSPGAGFDRPGELTVEVFYKLRLNAWFSIQPDLQFTHNPGGIVSRADAVMTTMQMLVDF
jgi:porin